MFSGTVAALRTVEEGVEVVVVDFAEFEKVFACLWARIYFEINDDIAQRCLEQDGHDRGWYKGWKKRTTCESATLNTRDEARRSANDPVDHISTISPTAPRPRWGTRWQRFSLSIRPTPSKSPLQMSTMHAASACSTLVGELGLQKMTTR